MAKAYLLREKTENLTPKQQKINSRIIKVHFIYKDFSVCQEKRFVSCDVCGNAFVADILRICRISRKVKSL